MTRPKSTHKDANHFIPRDFLRDRCGGFETINFGRTRAYKANYQGNQIVLFDMSDYGGIFSDWLIFCVDNREYRWIEIKTAEAYAAKGNGLTDGEKILADLFSYQFRIVVTDDNMQELMDWIILD